MGTLTASGAGISRYLSALLPRMIELAGEDVRWLLYGRSSAQFEAAPGSPHLLRGDGLPPDSGRVLSLVTSLPLWAWRDRPAVFWGPAHRLPPGLPAATACVVTIHDLCWLRAPYTMRVSTRWLDRLLMARAVRRADAVIAVSRATADDIAL